MTIQPINIGTTPNDGTGDDPRSVGQKLNSNFTTASHAASRDVGTATGQIPDADDLNMVGASVNYTSNNLNSLEFGGNAGSKTQGVAVLTTVALFKIKDSNASEPTSITVTGDFDILDNALAVVATGVTPSLSSSSGIGCVLVSVSTAGLVVGEAYWLTCNSSGSKIKIGI